MHVHTHVLCEAGDLGPAGSLLSQLFACVLQLAIAFMRDACAALQHHVHAS